MPRYLVYDQNQRLVNVMADKPNAATLQYSDPSLLSGQIPVWYPQGTPLIDVQKAVRVFIVRTSTSFPFDEIHEAVGQILGRYNPSFYSFLALGASPKPIKWVMRRQGVDVVAFSVSKVAAGIAVTAALQQKLQQKLAKLQFNNVVVLDYTHSGEGLVTIKNLVAQSWQRGIVAAVSLGRGPAMTEAFTQQINYFVQGTPRLTTCFENNAFKQAFGRAKAGIRMAAYPSQTVGNVLAGDMRRFAVNKSGFAEAADLPPIDLTGGLAEALLQTAIPRADDDADDNEELTW
jgi:hypothetical protein